MKFNPFTGTFEFGASVNITVPPGSVAGPVSSEDGHVPVWDGVDGNQLKDTSMAYAGGWLIIPLGVQAPQAKLGADPNFLTQDASALTAPRTVNWQDGDGTVAFIGDIPDTSGLVAAANNGSDFGDKAATLNTLGGASLTGSNTFTGSNVFNSAPVVPIADLAAATALAVGSYYRKSISGDLGPLTFSGTPAEGSTILLHLSVSGTRTVQFPSCYRNGEASSAITSLLFPPGEYILFWRYSSAKWILQDPVGPLHNSTTTNPGTGDDAADGYVAGRSVWINTSTGAVFLCRDATTSAAVWDELVARTKTQSLTAKIYALNSALGTDDTYEGIAMTGRNAGATIAQWDAVYLDSSSTWQLADANGTNTYPARGLAVAAYSSGNAATVLVRGTVRNDAWNWTPGGTLYLSTTAGGLTQTAPSTSGDKVQAVGFATSADEAYVDFTGTFLTVS